jgi:hypothetical protein
MNYVYKTIMNFATRLSKELNLQMSIHKEGKTLVCFLSEWQDLHPYAWVDINIGTYDKWMQDLHMSREIHGENDIYPISGFNEETQAMVRDARRKGEIVVWVEMAIRTMRHKRHNARYALLKGSKWEGGNEDFEYIKKWLEEQRALVAPEDVAALKVVNSRGFEPYYHEPSKTIIVRKNCKYGLLDKQGEIICEPLYDDIHPLRNGNVIVCKEKSWSLINRQGEILKNLEYDNIECFVDGFAVVTLGGKYGVIDESGNLISELKYDKIMQLKSISKYNEEDKFAEYFEACVDGKWGFLNKQGKEMSPFVYDEIPMRDFETGFVRVCKNGKWGYVNDKCEEMCEFIYEWDWYNFLRLGDKFYKPNIDGVLEEYVEEPVDDDDLPF